MGEEQVFVAPGPDGTPLTSTDLPWLAGRAVVLPAAQWRAVLAEARLLDPQRAAALERRGGDFSYDSDPEMHLDAAEMAGQLRFLGDLRRHLAAQGRLTAEPPADLDFVMDIDDYVGMVELVELVFEEAGRTRLPFRAWVEL
jgi:hypothetical protein